MLQVHITPSVLSWFPFSPNEIRRLMEAIVRNFGWKSADLEVLVTTDQEIARLNGEFLGLPGPTNVLSFPLDQNPEEGLNGSLVLSAHALRRESDLYAQDPAQYCCRLIVHAVLHLAGLEHGPRMEAMTESGLQAALEEIGNE
ncbi:MAG: rRNA maturation RNase YbeY [Desulfovermiculus sp.]